MTPDREQAISHDSSYIQVPLDILNITVLHGWPCALNEMGMGTAKIRALRLYRQPGRLANEWQVPLVPEVIRTTVSCVSDEGTDVATFVLTWWDITGLVSADNSQ